MRAYWTARCRAPVMAVCFTATVLALGLACPAVSLAQANIPLEAQLAAGEFAPARAAALQIADRNQRDDALAQIAHAQATGGSRQAALNTASEMSDDRKRTVVVHDVAPLMPVGKPGGAQADFDSLIELMTTTIAPTTWDAVGGPGSVQEFATGVYVDAAGLLKRAAVVDRSGSLLGLKQTAQASNGNSDVRRPSRLRKVSLPRLEREVQRLLAQGRAPTDAMQVLAGLERVTHVLAYPESGDLVLAGPAGDWITDAEGRLVSAVSNRPVVRLEDLVVILRHFSADVNRTFGCSITPTQDALARTQAFLAESNKTPLKPGTRDAWLKRLRNELGKQTIDVYSIDPRTRVAQVLVEADYRMKLVGMGLEDGVLGVESYLSSIHLKKGEAPPAMDVLRWWFTLNYQALLAAEDHQAFELRGTGVQVLSENELLDAIGKRIHTGKSSQLNEDFARSFTKHFPELAAKYPIYADMQNLFDLALASALIKSKKLDELAGWHQTCFGDPAAFAVSLSIAPKEVETVVNHRIVHQSTVIAGVSGGVRVDPSKYLKSGAIETDTYGKLRAEKTAGAPKKELGRQWWWD